MRWDKDLLQRNSSLLEADLWNLNCCVRIVACAFEHASVPVDGVVLDFCVVKLFLCIRVELVARRVAVCGRLSA